VDRNITIEKEVEKIVYVNQTKESEEPEIINDGIDETERKVPSWLWVIVIVVVSMSIVWIIREYQLRKKHKEIKLLEEQESS